MFKYILAIFFLVGATPVPLGGDLKSEFEFADYLEKNLEHIDEDLILKHINNIRALGEGSILTSDARAQIDLAFALVAGQFAKKTHSLTYGKMAYEKLIEALQLSPHDPAIVRSYSEAVIKIANGNFLARKTIEKGIGLTIPDCARDAQRYIEALPMPAELSDVYVILKKLDPKSVK